MRGIQTDHTRRRPHAANEKEEVATNFSACLIWLWILCCLTATSRSADSKIGAFGRLIWVFICHLHAIRYFQGEIIVRRLCKFDYFHFGSWQDLFLGLWDGRALCRENLRRRVKRRQYILWKKRVGRFPPRRTGVSSFGIVCFAMFPPRADKV